MIGGQSDSSFSNCTFFGNSAQSTAASHGLGGAVFMAELSLCIFDWACAFVHNTASPSTRQGSGGTVDPSAGAGGALAVINSGASLSQRSCRRRPRPRPRRPRCRRRHHRWHRLVVAFTAVVFVRARRLGVRRLHVPRERRACRQPQRLGGWRGRVHRDVLLGLGHITISVVVIVVGGGYIIRWAAH